jgi:hypothetical protein
MSRASVIRLKSGSAEVGTPAPTRADEVFGKGSVALAMFTLASLAVLLYTVGARLTEGS